MKGEPGEESRVMPDWLEKTLSTLQIQTFLHCIPVHCSLIGYGQYCLKNPDELEYFFYNNVQLIV